MKTRKITLLLAVAFVLFGAQTIKAGGPTETDQVTLNIKLHPIQTLVVNGSKEVDLNYTTKENYDQGVTVTQDNHLTFYSTGAFDINVKSEGTELKGKLGNIELSDVTIKATKGSVGIVDATYETITLSNSDNTLVTSNKGGVNQNVTVEYKAAGSDKYVNLYNKDENPTVFTTTVTYSIVAK